jgi:hypothetical protein
MPVHAIGHRLRVMHKARSPSAACRHSKRAAALYLAAVAVLGAGCTTAAPAGQTRFACYDVRGRLEASITNRGECEARNWEWRERQ